MNAHAIIVLFQKSDFAYMSQARGSFLVLGEMALTCSPKQSAKEAALVGFQQKQVQALVSLLELSRLWA